MKSGPSHWLELEGKTCVVTGAGGGLGIALAVNFAGAGARVVMLDRSPTQLATAAGEVLRLTGTEAHAVTCDVSDPGSVTEAALTSERVAGPADILVNNAALLRPGALDTLTLEDWNTVLSVNLGGYFLCAQAFGKQMRGPKEHRGGAMVHVASISGSHPQGVSGAYSVSKAGIIMLSRQIATEWGADGIRSNVVSPGMVETPMSAPFYATPGVREKRSDVIPVGRIGQPQDIADAALFLASARASYINGDEIVVDGGYTRQLMNLIPRPGYEKN